MSADLLKILFVVLCFQFLFVSIFLFQSRNGKSISNKLLAILFFMLSFAIINLYLAVFRIEVSFPGLLFIDDTFMFAYGPLLYVFTRSVLIKDYKIKNKDLLHFILFILALSAVITIILFADVNSLSTSIYSVETQEIPLYIRFGEMLILGHIFLYLIKSKLEVRKLVNKAYNTYSSLNNQNYKLLQFILNSFIILFVLSLMHSILPFVGIKSTLLMTLLLMVLFMFYFINSVLFKMLKLSTKESGIIAQSNINTSNKYASSTITKEELIEHKMNLWNYIIDNKRYLDSELNIDDLAKELNLSSKVLSQIINEGYACNFYDFINKFRIEAVKDKFTNQTDSKMTILEVMYSTGFNSKSSFNTAFKKFTKQTPTQFKNSL